MARIRKYTSTMPDTALPSPGLSSTAGAPRMSTPANDSSWTGWAISSFTNKLAAASGQMQSNATNGSNQTRPSSVPPSAPPKPDKPTAPPKPGMTLTKSTTSVPTISSPDPTTSFNDDAEDFSADWGGFGDDDGAGLSSKKEEEEDPWGTPSVTTSSTASAAFDDKGEPDFAGWLAAQSHAKRPTAKPLPKGLTKSSGAAKKPIVGGRTATATTTRKVVVLPKEVRKEAAKTNEEEEDGWGDAW